MSKAVYFFCNNLSKDHVASQVFTALEKLFELKDAGYSVENYSVKYLEDEKGNVFQFVRTEQVIGHNYTKYLPILNNYFYDAEFAGVVNWHEGADAPDKIFCIHSTGDVTSGYFGKAHPTYMRNLLLEIEENRQKFGLDDFKTLLEATHWSGVMYNKSQSPELITKYLVPLVDIEIGSIQSSWNNKDAVEVIARSLVKVFNSDKEVKSVLCVGGTHFTDVYSEAILNKKYPIGISHVLSNFWLERGIYENDRGFQKLENCINSITGRITGIAYHKKLKSMLKDQCRKLGEKLRIPVFNKNLLTNPIGLPIW